MSKYSTFAAAADVAAINPIAPIVSEPAPAKYGIEHAHARSDAASSLTSKISACRQPLPLPDPLPDPLPERMPGPPSGTSVSAVSFGTAQLDHAQVERIDGARHVVAWGGHRIAALRAASCLLTPGVGDRVLVSRSGTHAYLLAVLERAAATSAPIRLELSGDTQLSVVGGALTVQAEGGIALDGGPRLTLNAVDASAQFEQASLLSQVLQTSGGVHRSLWREQSSICERHSLTALRAHAELGDSTRHVAGCDDSVAAAMQQRVSGRWSVSARVADVYAERRVSIDAALQVQLG